MFSYSNIYISILKSPKIFIFFIHFQGTNLRQPRFIYNEWEELRYGALMTQRIDTSRVKLEFLMPWITDHFSNVYNIEDFLYEEFQNEQYVCPKVFQLRLLKFLSVHKVQQFSTDLWQILLLAQESGIGMPRFVMEQLEKNEILKKEEEKKRHCLCCRCNKRDDDLNSNPSSSKREKARSTDKQLDKNTSPRNRSKDKSVQRGYPSSDSCSPRSDKDSEQSSKTSRSKLSQKKQDNSCNRNSKSRSKSVEKQGSSSTSKYALKRCDDTSDDSDESPPCARCRRPSSSSQSSVSSNRSRSPRR